MEKNKELLTNHLKEIEELKTKIFDLYESLQTVENIKDTFLEVSKLNLSTSYLNVIEELVNIYQQVDKDLKLIANYTLKD